MKHQIIQQALAARGYAVVRGADGTQRIVLINPPVESGKT